MKRTVIGILLSAATFAIGYGIAWLCISQPVSGPPQPSVECPSQILTTSLIDVPAPEPASTPDFAAEIMDLWDFADLGLQDFEMKLIDIHEHENVYRKSEVIAKNGQRWLGLFENNGKFYLRNTKTKVKFDPNYEGYGDEDYMRLTTSDKGDPVFLLRNTRGLKSGPVETLYLRPSFEEIERRRLFDKPTKIGFEEYFSLGDDEYLIRVSRGLTIENEKVVAMTLSLRGVSQAITYLPYSRDDDTVGHLVWVGDLDGDKKLDLYLDHDGYETCGFSSGLFLSSASTKKGEFVRQVAAFGTAGC